MTLKIEDNNYFDETVFYTILYNEKKNGFGFFPNLNRDPGDPKRPDPDPQHCYAAIEP